MVFFAEIAFIYRGNNSSEDVFGSEKSSEKNSERSSETTAISSETGSGTDVTSSGTLQKTSEKIIELINADPQILPSIYEVYSHLGIDLTCL